MKLLVIASVLAGCDAALGIDLIELPTDASAGHACIGKSGGMGLFSWCPDVPLPDELNVVSDLDTDAACTRVLQQDDGSDVCVVAASRLTISTSVTVHGSRPAVLFAESALTIEPHASVDVASHASASGVGGFNCPRSDGNSDKYGGGGGAGGSFAAVGGRGGTTPDVMAAQPSAPVTPGTIRGGCAGARGGAGADGSGPGGAPGAGGGAVYLVAGELIDVSGVINASGASGDGGSKPGSTGGGGGGGGAGSGGLIGLDAPSIRLASTAILVANGGAGGGGASSFTGTPMAGEAGTDSLVQGGKAPFASIGGAGGGSAGARGGDGAANAAAMAGADRAAPVMPGGGAGGGGGSSGYVVIFTTELADNGATMLPPAMP